MYSQKRLAQVAEQGPESRFSDFKIYAYIKKKKKTQVFSFMENFVD